MSSDTRTSNPVEQHGTATELIDAGTPQRILIIKPSSLGDVIHALPVLNCLRSYFSNSHITWLISSVFQDILTGHPELDEIIPVSMNTWKRLPNIPSTLREIVALKHTLKTSRFDLVLDLQGLLRSGIMSWFTDAPLRIGFNEAREGSTRFYTHTVSGGTDVHAVERYLRMARAVGCDTSGARFVFPDCTSPVSDTQYAVLVPGARWDTKIWPAERFGQVAAALPFKSYVIGSKSDAERASIVVEHSAGKAVSLTGLTGLRELVGLTRGAQLMVTNDSGPMHIGAALSIPVFAIFGPTSAVRTGPYALPGSPKHMILQSERPCVPCFSRQCADGLACMMEITAERVIEGIKERGLI